MNVCHVISGLGRGGAEMMLVKLVREFERQAYGSSTVVSLTDAGVHGSRLRDMGIPVRCLNLDPRFPNPLKLLELGRWFRDEDFDVIQTWMYHADLVGGLAAMLDSGTPVVWGIRRSNLEPDRTKTSVRLLARACGTLSGPLPDLIVSNSQEGRRVHAAIGYDDRKIVVIPNGFDLTEFQPQPGLRAKVRDDLGLSSDAPVAIVVSKDSPQKDIPTLVQALAIVCEDHPRFKVMLCGTGLDRDNAALRASLTEAGVQENVVLLGQREDIPSLHAASDFLISSSAGEGFSNAIGEALASGLPCVVTDAGDSARIVGDAGIVVPTEDAASLADGIHELLALDVSERKALGEKGRDRIRDRFAIEEITSRFAAVYTDLSGDGSAIPSG